MNMLSALLEIADHMNAVLASVDFSVISFAFLAFFHSIFLFIALSTQPHWVAAFGLLSESYRKMNLLLASAKICWCVPCALTNPCISLESISKAHIPRAESNGISFYRTKFAKIKCKINLATSPHIFHSNILNSIRLTNILRSTFLSIGIFFVPCICWFACMCR